MRRQDFGSRCPSGSASRSAENLAAGWVFSAGPHPREQMWLIYKQMRERGELNLKPLAPFEEYQNRISELEAKVAELEAGSVPALLDVPTVVERVPIDPSDVVPPSERRGVPPMRGPDDPPRRSPPVIEGRAVRPNPPGESA